MKQTLILIVLLMFFSIMVVAHASAGCVITWSGSRSGSIPTNETSKTPQARHEAYSAIFAGDGGSSGCSGPCCAYYDEDPEYGGCLYSVPEGCDGGFSWMLGQKTTRRVCDTGEWRRYFCSSHQGSGCPCSPGGGCTETGSWDVICDLKSTTTTTMVTTTTTATLTVVTLIEFKSVSGNRIITLAWSTACEIDNAGFNLYRSTSENGEYIKINDSLIPAIGSSTEGASYEFVDTNVHNRRTYYYKLEDIDINGVSTFHGPVAATPRLIYGLRK